MYDILCRPTHELLKLNKNMREFPLKTYNRVVPKHTTLMCGQAANAQTNLRYPLKPSLLGQNTFTSKLRFGSFSSF